MDRFVGACHEVAKHALVRCSCGNLSMRVGEQTPLARLARSIMMP
ncbi:MAG: hypothetical protein ACYC9J_04890 [Sulfuricaulis sp.]